ncbi:MAG: TldD/PmbA family protein [Promethearchaeota archaeon]
MSLFEDGFFHNQSEKIYSLIKNYPSIKHVEIYANALKSTKVNFEAGFIKDASQRTSAGIGIRVIDTDGREGFTFTSDFSDYAIDITVRNSYKMMKAATPNPDFKDLAHPQKKYVSVSGIYDPALEDICPEEINEILHPIFDLKKKELAPKSLSGSFSNSVGGTFIWNNNGISIWDRFSTASVTAEVGLSRSSIPSSGFNWQSECQLKNINTKSIAEESYAMALRGLKKTTIETKEYPVVFSPLATAYFLIDPITSAINAERVQNQMSFLGDYLDRQIGSPKLSIKDDPHIHGHLGTEPFDAEGIATQPITILEKGVLKSFYHNTFTAGKFDLESNGHASRGMYNAPLGISNNNLIIESGDRKKDDLIGDLKEGIYFEYSGDSPNLITGDFSGLIMTGYLIKDGIIGPALSESMIALNLFDAFKNIEVISKERKWIDEALVPWIEISNVKIASR